jgi:hypothetical protein
MANPNPKRENLVHFSSSYQPENRGRKKSFVSSLKADGYTKSDIRTTISTIFGMSFDELAELQSKPEMTVLEATICSVVAKGIKTGDVKTLESLSAIAFGKTKEVKEIPPRPELSAAKAYYNDLISKGKSEDEAISIVLKDAKAAGFDLDADEILKYVR